MKTKITSKHKKFLADTLTPVSIFLRLRDQFPYPVLMESSDYQSSENSRSIICASPISEFTVQDNKILTESHTGEKQIFSFSGKEELLNQIDRILSSFEIINPHRKISFNGFFGYTAYDAVQYFEKIKLNTSTDNSASIPEMHYKTYRFVIVVEHFRNEIHVFENLLENQQSRIEEVIAIIRNRNFPIYDFRTEGEEVSYLNDSEFLKTIGKGISHCHRGDVYQIVLSRRYSQNFRGDDFNVYRILRSINPSPYLFYFDMGHFRIFGSSPEAQLTIQGNKASIFPIAGTFKRQGNDEADRNEAIRLKNDIKENSEHVMLVDLARNDLSRNGTDTLVESFKEIQYYSHVIHLVSKVSATLPSNGNLNVIADTFPAGTLTGAPKFRAMELITGLENLPRGFYGGAIGFLGFNADYNHAIMIRSFISRHNQLTYQAGAGIVAKSNPEKELEEVNNKLSALRIAIREAQNIKW